jgi:ketosteroid isomerase-like protein
MGNADVVRTILDAWNRGDDGWVELVADDFELVNPDDAVDSGTRLGRDGLRKALGNLVRSFEHHQYDLHDVVEHGDEVVATVLFTARGRASGVEITDRIGYWWTLRNGRAVRAEWFRDPQAAREAAGLARD